MSEPFKGTDAFIAGVIDLLIEYFRVFFLPRLGVSGFHPNTPTRLGRVRQWREYVRALSKCFIFILFYFSIFFSFFKTGFLFIVLAMVFSLIILFFIFNF